MFPFDDVIMGIRSSNKLQWLALRTGLQDSSPSGGHLSDIVLGPIHDDVIKWKHFPPYWPFSQGIHRWPVNSPHKGQWRGASMFSLICAWINGWVNNREADDLRRNRAHYDVTVMCTGMRFTCNEAHWVQAKRLTALSPRSYPRLMTRCLGSYKSLCLRRY